jgi:ubiquinone biosynthesis protein
MMRFLKILYIVLRYRLLSWLLREKLPLPLRGLLLFIPKGNPNTQGMRLRQACEALGPVFIKFGQMLSTRRDLLSDEAADSLALLQDQVTPFDGELAITMIEQAFGQSITDIYAQFDKNPLASASVAQVHTATLLSGESVVVKVIRPHIKAIIEKDMALLLTLARFVELLWDDGKRLRLTDIVRDYRHTLLDELDLLREAANTSQLKRHFNHSPLLYVPTIYWDFTRKNIMTMERIYGVQVTDLAALHDAEVNMKVLAERGVEIFFAQVFDHNFFHADMHPGNVFVSTENPTSPQYIALDCAIMGSLTDEDQDYLARNFLAFFSRDYREVAQLHIDSGWVPANTSLPEFEAAIRSVCEPIFEKPLKDISLGLLLLRLFQTARRFNMSVQPQLVLLQKTLLYIEGLGRQLYPELDLWTTAKPFLEKWMRARSGPRGFIKTMMKEAPEVFTKLPELPRLVWDVLDQLKSLDQLSQKQQAAVNEIKEAIVINTRKRRSHLLGLVSLIAALVFWQHAADLPGNAQPWLSTLCMLLGIYWITR